MKKVSVICVIVLLICYSVTVYFYNSNARKNFEEELLESLKKLRNEIKFKKVKAN